MNKPVALFVITSDPRISGRPAEAIRIAAGVGTWRKTDVRIYLHGPAVLALGEWVDELVDEDNYTRYLPILAELPQAIHVQADAPELEELGDSPFSFNPAGLAELQSLCRQSTYILRF